MPAVCIGNDGQLAMDLLLSTLPVTHLGHLPSRDVLPFVAPSPKLPSHKRPSVTGLQLYLLRDNESDIILVQQRSPSAKGKASMLGRAVAKWAVDNGCIEVLVLASANAAGALGRAFQKVATDEGPWPAFRVAMTTKALKADGIRTRAAALGILPLSNPDGDPRGWSSTLFDNVDLDRIESGDSIPRFLPTARRGSFVRTLLEECEVMDIKLTTLVHFVHEGDNARDALVMASAVALLLNVGMAGAVENGRDSNAKLKYLISHWNPPDSWKDQNDVPEGLF